MAGRFTFAPDRCTGCQACVVACWMEHRNRQTRPWRQVLTYNPFHHPALPVFHLSLACHHCENPACMPNCPAGAYARDAATGAVTVDPERCLGCRYCTWACPHDAPKYDPVAGTIQKCTFCQSRLQKGLPPACVARCPLGALGWEEGREAASEAAPPGFPPSSLRPAIRFTSPRPGPRVEPGAERGFLARVLDRELKLPQRRITLKGEWSLVVFTTTIACLAAWQAASLLGGPPVHAVAFLGAGAGAMGLSLGHLGRKARAWRALSNLANSWLSREILLVSAFLGVAALQALAPRLPALGLACALLGFASLFAIDRLYRIATRSGLHSAHVLLNGLYLTGLLAGSLPLALATGALKAALYLHRKLRGPGARHPRPILSLVRLLLGFLAPALLPPPFTVLSAAAGDLVDRCEFYDELEVPTPQQELAQACREAVGVPEHSTT